VPDLNFLDLLITSP